MLRLLPLRTKLKHHISHNEILQPHLEHQGNKNMGTELTAATENIIT